MTIGSRSLVYGGGAALLLCATVLAAVLFTAPASRPISAAPKLRSAARLAVLRDTRPGIHAVFPRQGAAVRAPGVSWSLGLRAVGRGSTVVALAAVSPSVTGKRITYRREGVAEWYVSGPLGLEQGFTLASRPAGAQHAPVTLGLGELPLRTHATIAHDGRSLALTRAGHVVLRYWGLSAADARGHPLPAQIAVAGRRMSLQIDDRGARYPLRVDPFVQAAKLTASDGASNDELGLAVAVSGDTMVVGVPRSGSSQGAVYVFVRPASGWANATETAKLTAADGASADQLGSSVAISGDAIIAGAPGAAVGGHLGQGAAYVFVKPAGGWGNAAPHTAKLTVAGEVANDSFGISVAVSGDTAVVGAPQERVGPATGPGAAYVFVKPAGGWADTGTPVARLTASDGVAPDNFGNSTAIDGDTIVAGAKAADISGNTDQGAVYVFDKPAGGWATATETARLTASDATNVQLGFSVSVSVDTVVAGAPFPFGRVYVFVKPAGGWASGHETARLTGSDEASGDGLGESTGVSGDTIIAGAPTADVAGGSNRGAVYVFSKPGGGWTDGTETSKLTASDGSPSDQLGFSAGIADDTVAAGAPGASSFQGALYAFVGSPATSTTVDCQPGSVGVGATTTCTATVSDLAAGGATPTGSVAFSSDGSGSFAPDSTCHLTPAGPAGAASCSVGYTPSAVGQVVHHLTASYNGDGAHNGSIGNGAVMVTGAGGTLRPTSTSVSCVPASVSVGSVSRCAATVTDSGVGSPNVPTGTVGFTSDSHGTFSDASCTLTAVNAITADCVVGYTPTAIDSGTHTITASYSGNGAHGVSSGRGSVGASAVVPLPPQNIAPPSISQDESCQWLVGRPHCETIPFQYVCDPGQWTGNDPEVPYGYEWQQLHYSRVGPILTPLWETVGTGQTYYASRRIISGDTSGTFRCVVTATGPGGSTAADSPGKLLDVGPPLPRGIAPVRPVDITVTGIEVTQAVQVDHCGGCYGSLPSRDQRDSHSPGQATDKGVTLAQGKITVVRVYAHVASGTLAGATAQLDVLDADGKRINTLSAISSPAELTPSTCAGICVNGSERANPSSSFDFVIPWVETYRDFISLRATVTPPVGPGQGGLCADCRGNVFTLYFVPFVPVATVQIHPIPLTVGGVATTVSADQVFAGAQTLFPVQLNIRNYDPVRPVDGLSNSDAAIAVLDRGADDNLPLGEYPVGVFVNGAGGFGGNTITQIAAGGLTDSSSIVPDSGRPLTAVAHELGHGLGLFHADTGGACSNDPNVGCPGPHPDGTPDCGGNAWNGTPNSRQLGESWPPDDEGRLQSIGLDIRNWNLGSAASSPATFVEGFDHQGNPTKGNTANGGPRYYDIMSYCPAGGVYLPSPNVEPLDWISARNWSRLIDYPGFDRCCPAGAANHRPRAVSGMPVRVMAVAQPGGAVTIREVTAGARTRLDPTPGSPFRIELRDGAGRTLTSAVPATATIHVDGVGKAQGLLLAATLPFTASAASVAITSGGQEVARRTRSTHAPTGRFVSPRAGSRLGSGRATVVRWSARDADGDRLTATVQYSPDGGRDWKVVADAVSGHSVRIPSHFLSASTNARLRVRISDGFNTATAQSGRLRAVGAPPLVRIIGALRGRVRGDTTLLLQASASDDTGRPLTGRHLRWYLGKRPIGRGAKVTLRNLRPGRTLVRVVATDAHGRSTQATAPLRVKSSAPAYLLFDAPLLVSAHARTVRITVASSGPATLLIAAKRYTVGTRPRRLTIRIRPGRKLLVLRCSLRSRGGVVSGRYVLSRR